MLQHNSNSSVIENELYFILNCKGKESTKHFSRHKTPAAAKVATMPKLARAQIALVVAGVVSLGSLIKVFTCREDASVVEFTSWMITFIVSDKIFSRLIEWNSEDQLIAKLKQEREEMLDHVVHLEIKKRELEKRVENVKTKAL